MSSSSLARRTVATSRRRSALDTAAVNPLTIRAARRPVKRNSVTSNEVRAWGTMLPSFARQLSMRQRTGADTPGRRNAHPPTTNACRVSQLTGNPENQCVACCAIIAGTSVTLSSGRPVSRTVSAIHRSTRFLLALPTPVNVTATTPSEHRRTTALFASSSSSLPSAVVMRRSDAWMTIRGVMRVMFNVISATLLPLEYDVSFLAGEGVPVDVRMRAALPVRTLHPLLAQPHYLEAVQEPLPHLLLRRVVMR